ncbi:hypothetical protein B0J12DRAFT_654743 [Macrophomina phaseolina]|uniref:Secreted protein n=1 Tax=Macrophomina phaseolina TaxID=35725 RepID=A0ABQ8GIZ4_9PEZI|nr:hypothetical protein B0J12DRAFT_654743 [Macrophomina phaseolina]
MPRFVIIATRYFFFFCAVAQRERRGDKQPTYYFLAGRIRSQGGCMHGGWKMKRVLWMIILDPFWKMAVQS